MKRYREIGQIVAVVFIFVLFFRVVQWFLVPVTLGLLVSLVFRPVYVRLSDRLGKRPRLAALTSLLLLLIGVFLPFFVIGSIVIRDVSHLSTKFASQSSASVKADVLRGITKIYPIRPDQFDQAYATLLTNAATAGKNLSTLFAKSIPKVLTSFVFFLISFFFGLVDGPRFADFLRLNSPFTSKDTDQLFRTSHRICNAVVLGAVLAAIVQGIIIGLGYWITGLPNPVLFGALTTIFGLIPMVGSAPAGLGGTIYLVATGEFLKAIVMAIAFALAGISDNVVKPWVLKGKTSLHPLLGLMSVLGGMMAFGVAGIFLGPLVTALTIVFIQLLHHRVQTMRKEQSSDLS